MFYKLIFLFLSLIFFLFYSSYYGYNKLSNHAFSVNVGWNSLTGFGAQYSSFHKNNVSIDFGSGLGLSGPKLGLRVNYKLYSNTVAPFFGIGTIHAFGGSIVNVSNSISDYSVKAEPASSLLLSSGFEFNMYNFFGRISGGYCFVVSKNYFSIHQGSLSSRDYQNMESLFGSGYSIELSFGFLF